MVSSLDNGTVGCSKDLGGYFLRIKVRSKKEKKLIDIGFRGFHRILKKFLDDY